MLVSTLFILVFISSALGFAPVLTRRTFASTIAIASLTELYSRSGQPNESNVAQLTNLPHKKPALMTIVFHGAGGQDKYTAELIERLNSNNNNNYVHICDWSVFSQSIVKAAFNAQRVGKIQATRIASNYDCAVSVHFIGISVGAFAADAAAKELKRLSKKSFVQLTLLDPFTQRGVFGFGWGKRHFGEGVDYCQQFMNTDDPVPSTNVKCNHAVCFDVTESSKRDKDIFGHDWPLVFFSRHVANIGLIDENERGSPLNEATKTL